jgi:hypothetical protein
VSALVIAASDDRSTQLGTIGALVGFAIGGPAGASIGFGVGSGVGAKLDAGRQKAQGPRVGDLQVTSAEYGQPIPWVLGSPRIAGQIWWASERREIATSERAGKGGGPTTTSFTYEIDVLVGLCEALPNGGVLRIWSNGELVYSVSSISDQETYINSISSDKTWRRITFYRGGDTQQPDAVYAAAVGADDAIAYRGRFSVFIEGLQLGGSGQIPNLTFEVASGVVGGPSTFNVLLAEPPRVAGTVTPESYIGAIHVDENDDVNALIFGSGTSDDPLTRGRHLRVSRSGAVSTVGTFDMNQTTQFPRGSTDVLCQLIYHSSPGNYRVFNGAGLWFTAQAPVFAALVPAHFVLKAGRLYIASGQASKEIWRFAVGSDGGPLASGVLTAAIQSMDASANVLACMQFSGTGSTGQVYLYDPLSLALLSSFDGPLSPASSGQMSIHVDVNDAIYVVENTANGRMWRREGSGWALASNNLGVPSMPLGTASTSGQRTVKNGVFYALRRETSGTVRFQVYRCTPALSGSLVPIADAVQAVANRAGVPGAAIEVAALSGITKPLRSVAVSQVTAARAILEQFQAGWFFDAAVSDKLRFRPRASAPVATIPYADLAAGIEQPEAQPLPLQIASDLELPPQVAVTYINAASDGATGTEWSDRLISGQGSTSTLQLGIGMLPEEAKGIADAVMADGVASLTRAAIALPPKYARLEPADVIEVVDDDGSTYRMRIARREDAGGLLRLDCVLDDPSVVVSAGITATAYPSQGVVTRRGGTAFLALDIPLLRDADDGPGYYVAARSDGNGTWPGAVVLSSGNDVDFTSVAEVQEQAVFGTCTTTLANWTGGWVMDEINTLGVTMGTGELESVTREVLLADETANVLLVGSEVIRFTTATLTGANPNTYTLSRLLRGQRGTEWAIAGHTASERAVLLRPRGLRRVTTQASEVGQLRHLKGVTAGTSPDAVDSVSFTNTDVGRRPLAPVDARSVRLLNGDVLMTWKRRTRYAASITGPAGINAPVDQAPQSYRLTLYRDGARVFPVRTLNSSTPQVTYTSALLQQDAGLYQDGVLYTRIVEIGADGQVGRALDATLSPSLAPGAGAAAGALLLADFGPVFDGALTVFAAANDTLAGSVTLTTADGSTFARPYAGTSQQGPSGLLDVLHAASATVRLSITWLNAIGASPDVKAAYLAASNSAAPDLRAGAPRVGGSGAYIQPYALGVDGSTFHLVGVADGQSSAGSGLHLYTCTDGVTWAHQGEMAQDGGDPNVLGAAVLGAFNNGLFAGLPTRAGEVTLQRISGRWFLSSRFALYYTDTASALSGWLRAPTGLGEGTSNPWTTLTDPLQFDGKLVVARRTFGTIAYSSDNGATWTQQTVGMAAFEGIGRMYVAHGQLVLHTGPNVWRNSALPGTWTSAPVLGLDSVWRYAVIAGAPVAIDVVGAQTGFPQYVLKTSADSATWSAATMP